MAESKNLWPEFTAEKITLPKNILVEQANYLSAATKQTILGKVTQSKIGNELVFRFKIKVPSLDDYSFDLFYIRHDVLIPYPISLVWDSKTFQIGNESDFTKKLEEIFTAPSTSKIISSVLAQVEPPTGDDLPY